MPENIDYCRVRVIAAASYRRRFIAALVPVGNIYQSWSISKQLGAFAGTSCTPRGGERQRP
jgi:hypothetical protein